MKTTLQKCIAAIALMIACYGAKAQSGFSGGLMGGISTGAVEINDIDEAFTDAVEGNVIGYEGGIYAKLMLDPFYIKPAVLYNFRSGEVNYNDATSNSSQTADFSVHKIEVPLLLGLNLVGPLNIDAGPVYNYLLTVTDRYNSNTVDLGRNGFGYRAGANLDFGTIMIGLSYQGAFYNSGSNRATFYEPYKIVLGLGIRLGGSDGKE